LRRIEIYGCSIERRLKSTLGRACKRNKGLYEAVIKKMDEVIKNPYHYKPLRHDLKGSKRVHIGKSYVLIFEIDETTKTIRFLDLGHHDEIYGKRR